MLGHGNENQTTTNKCFLLPTAAILKQIIKGLSGLSAAEGLKLVFLLRSVASDFQTCAAASFFHYQADEGVSFLFLESLGVQFWQGDIELSQG